ncbi:MAG TPA: hypothetical protein VMX16_16435 [Terriglobia bacterium]|nr:hypothetical protein [Terriglobia bacterium]
MKNKKKKQTRTTLPGIVVKIPKKLIPGSVWFLVSEDGTRGLKAELKSHTQKDGRPEVVFRTVNLRQFRKRKSRPAPKGAPAAVASGD